MALSGLWRPHPSDNNRFLFQALEDFRSKTDSSGKLALRVPGTTHRSRESRPFSEIACGNVLIAAVLAAK